MAFFPPAQRAPRHGRALSHLRLLRSLCSSHPPPLPSPPSDADADEPPTTAISASDAALLDKLHSLIKDHHRRNPSAAEDLPFDFTTPPLSASFSSVSHPSALSPSLVHHLIHRCAALRHGIPFPQTLAFFNWWLSSSAAAAGEAEPFDAMIDLSGKLQRFDLAWRLVEAMRSRGAPPTLRTFSAIIRRYARAGLTAEAAHAFHRMDDYGCPRPRRLLHPHFRALQKRRAADAQAFFDALSGRFPPDVVVYTSVVHAWCRARRIDEAQRVLREMADRGIRPNVYTYSVLIDALCRAGQINQAQEVLAEMIGAGCAPNAATFNSLMRAHVKAGHTQKALEVYNQMKRLGCAPDVITYNFLVEAHCRDGEVGSLDAAVKLLNQMVARGCCPNASTFNHLLRCVLKLGDVNAAHKLYSKMKEVKCPGNTVTYNLLMQLFGKARSTDMVLRMRREMDEEGVEANVNTYKALISVFCAMGHWNRGYRLLREMIEEKGMQPTAGVCQAVLSLLKRAGQLTKHDELVEKLAERGFHARPS